MTLAESPELASIWTRCTERLKESLSYNEYVQLVAPLVVGYAEGAIRITAPTEEIRAKFERRVAPRLRTDGLLDLPVSLEVESPSRSPKSRTSAPAAHRRTADIRVVGARLNPDFRFDTFIEGKSNQLAKAAAGQVSENPGRAYNPLFLYGGVGLGKTHLMHAIANSIHSRDVKARIAYVHSERFVGDMVRALQTDSLNEFETAYRSLDVLLIDDIQFFAGKERPQEEFFHTFNALLEGQHQVILTCDRYPREVAGLEERLKSRVGSGLTTAVEPPDIETSVAILISKATLAGTTLPEDVAFFMASRIRSNVRELEGALRRVIANSRFTGYPITLAFVQEALRDLLSLQQKLLTVENIQRAVAEYYKLPMSEFLSKRRSRFVALPRQVAMALARELTSHSLAEIGNAFGGRDNSTVLHACRRITGLRGAQPKMQQDYATLLRALAG